MYSVLIKMFSMTCIHWQYIALNIMKFFFMQMIDMQRPLTPGPSFKNQTYPSQPLRKISRYALVLIYQSCKTFLFLELGYKTL